MMKNNNGRGFTGMIVCSYVNLLLSYIAIIRKSTYLNDYVEIFDGHNPK